MKPIAFEKRITAVTPDLCREHGLRALLLDVDNTLALHGNPVPAPGVAEWVRRMEQAGIVCVIVSNNNAERVSAFAAGLGLPFVANAAKPLPWGLKKAMALAGAVPKETALIGDQILTDLLGAGAAGISMILLEPIREEESGFLRVKRKIDQRLRKMLYGR